MLLTSQEMQALVTDFRRRIEGELMMNPVMCNALEGRKRGDALSETGYNRLMENIETAIREGIQAIIQKGILK